MLRGSVALSISVVVYFVVSVISYLLHVSVLLGIDMYLFHIQLSSDQYWICEMCVCLCVYVYICVSQHTFQQLLHTCCSLDTTFVILYCYDIHFIWNNFAHTSDKNLLL